MFWSTVYDAGPTLKEHRANRRACWDNNFKTTYFAQKVIQQPNYFT